MEGAVYNCYLFVTWLPAFPASEARCSKALSSALCGAVDGAGYSTARRYIIPVRARAAYCTPRGRIRVIPWAYGTRARPRRWTRGRHRSRTPSWAMRYSCLGTGTSHAQEQGDRR